MKRADRRSTITVLVLGDEGVGKSSLISTFVSRYFSEVVPGLMTRVRLPPDPDTSCITTIVDSQGGDAALLAAVADVTTTGGGTTLLRTAPSSESLATLLEKSTTRGTTTTTTAATAAAPSGTTPGTSAGTRTTTPRSGGGAAAAGSGAAADRSTSLSSSRLMMSASSSGGSTTTTTTTTGIENVDSILLVYDLDRVETFFRLESHWLPLIERCYQGKVPVIVAENKVDLYRPSSSAGVMDEQALARKRQQIVSLMQRFPFVRQCIKCSAKNLLRVDDVFIKAQQAVLYPFTPPLYDLDTGKLTVECKMAFTRIFRMFDRDHDGLLSDAELDRFQRETYHVAVFDRDFAAWKKVVTRNNPSPTEVVIQDGKFTVAGFLAIFDVFISQNRLDVVWQALRKFGYDDDLNLHVPESVIAPSDDNAGWKLSSPAKKFLAALFHQFDSNNDGILLPEDLANMLSILPPPALPPWHPLRRAALFGDAFSMPKQDGDRELLATAAADSQASPSGSPGQSIIVPGATSMSQSLSQSGISILSAGDSLPSVEIGSSPQVPISRPVSFLEWMGQWHLISAISPSVTRAELFRLGHVEEVKSKKHESTLRRSRRWKKSVAPMTNLESSSAGAATSDSPSAPTDDSDLKSREIRVLVLGSQNCGKTALLNYLRRSSGSPQRKSLERMLVETALGSPVETTSTMHPETSTTFAKLKRQSKSSGTSGGSSGKLEEEEFVVHLIFTDVPETAATSQEEHYRELSELFGSVTSPKDRVCDLAMLVFDCTKTSSLMYAKELESNLLTKETPRVFIGTKADLIQLPGESSSEASSVVVDAAKAHCLESDLEEPLLVSAKEFSIGPDRIQVLDHLARCALNEPGIVRLKSKPHEEQKRKEAAWRRKMLWLGVVSVGVVVAVGVSLLWGGGSGKKGDRKGGPAGVGWFRSWFGGGSGVGSSGGPVNSMDAAVKA